MAGGLSKEVATRKRIAAIYNKRQDDFPSLREYNDYLEEVEDIVFKLVEGVDAAATEAQVAKYKEENSEQILVSFAKTAQERRSAIREQQGPAAVPEAAEIKPAEAAAEGDALQYAPSMPAAPPPFLGAPVPQAAHPAEEVELTEEEKRLRVQRSMRAGGYVLDWPKKRALEEALNSLTMD